MNFQLISTKLYEQGKETDGGNLVIYYPRNETSTNEANSDLSPNGIENQSVPTFVEIQDNQRQLEMTTISAGTFDYKSILDQRKERLRLACQNYQKITKLARTGTFGKSSTYFFTYLKNIFRRAFIISSKTI